MATTTEQQPVTTTERVFVSAAAFMGKSKVFPIFLKVYKNWEQALLQSFIQMVLAVVADVCFLVIVIVIVEIIILIIH